MIGLAFLRILLLDVGFLAVCVLAVAPLIAYKKAAFAVLKRNFVGYFSNPTGYVFLCLFVFLTSVAAFWPHEFFTANLANLDQLNKVLPLIMLVFIPAITMSIWAEERRQGTDELLLTLPADDFDIVFGKYLAAAAIFTASLMFSQFSNYVVLASLSQGNLDTGLFFTTYLGYWLVGLAMLAVGMVASFLTSNMTVGFILGAAFNAPLAGAIYGDVIISASGLARNVSFWSLGANFEDFGRGVISISSAFYFALLVAIGLYLSMVLIGARHWGGRGGPWQFLHFVTRAVALVVVLVAGLGFFTDHDWIRKDMTEGQVASLSPKTKELIKGLESEHPIVIDAFIGASVPETYVQTKFNLLSLLKEFDALSRGKIEVRLHTNLEPFSEEAALARDRFGIEPTVVNTRSRGTMKSEEVILGAAFTCGLEKVVVPFFDYGIPVEYELIRSIGTVAEGERKKLGLVRTDAQLMGGFSFAGGMPQQIPRQEIVDELDKQYDIEEVDPTSPIEQEKYDVLMVVQPSSLGPGQLPNVVEAIKAGMPTAIFEDPAPLFLNTAPGTGQPKQAPGGGMFGGGQQPQPKGRIQDLWDAIGIDPPGERGGMMGLFNPDIGWQQYNPYRKYEEFPDSFVFASTQAPGVKDPINEDDAITRGLNEVLFPAPGVIEPDTDSELEFIPLLKTGNLAGTIRFEQYQTNQRNPAAMLAAQGTAKGEQILAARIRGVPEEEEDDNADDEDSEDTEADSDDDGSDEGKSEDGDDDASEDAESEDEDADVSRPVNVVYVADVDVMDWRFLRIRARPEDATEVDFRFENVNFLLNVIDSLAGGEQYVEIRRRKPLHTTLRLVEEKISEQREREREREIKFEEDMKEEVEKVAEENRKIEKELEDQLEALQAKQREGAQDFNPAELIALMQRIAIKKQQLQQKKDVTEKQLKREADEQVAEVKRQTDLKILGIQNWYKFLAVIIPPIPPLLVGLVVFVSRRLREREGIIKARLRV